MARDHCVIGTNIGGFSCYKTYLNLYLNIFLMVFRDGAIKIFVYFLA